MTTTTNELTSAHLETTLRHARSRGRRLLVPYVMAGIVPEWTTLVTELAAAGADAIEIGLPFSDPMADGPTLQEANARALNRGVTIAGLLTELAELPLPVPTVVMTYTNLVHACGVELFGDRLVAAGVAGAILPDLPVEDSVVYRSAMAERALATVLLAAPSSTDERLAQICAASTGFVYAVSSMGTTGERQALTTSATEIAQQVRRVTDKPVLVGFGVSTARHATSLAAHADGVIMASALMRRVLDGAGPADVAAGLAEVRAALDGQG
jgi:tryptophan synthase alpha chain